MEFIVSFGTFSIHLKIIHNRKMHQEPRSFSEKSSAVLGMPRLGVERRKARAHENGMEMVERIEN